MDDLTHDHSLRSLHEPRSENLRYELCPVERRRQAQDKLKSRPPTTVTVINPFTL